MEMPKDPVILLSMINMKLRDEFSDLEELCLSLGVDQTELKNRLKGIDYEYDTETNQFV